MRTPELDPRGAFSHPPECRALLFYVGQNGARQSPAVGIRFKALDAIVEIVGRLFLLFGDTDPLQSLVLGMRGCKLGEGANRFGAAHVPHWVRIFNTVRRCLAAVRTTTAAISSSQLIGFGSPDSDRRF